MLEQRSDGFEQPQQAFETAIVKDFAMMYPAASWLDESASRVSTHDALRANTVIFDFSLPAWKNNGYLWRTLWEN